MDKHNNNLNIIYAFTRFLKEEGVYAKYIKYRCGASKTKYYLKNGDFPASAVRYVSGAFNWSTTPERHRFWQAINSDWDSVCRDVFAQMEPTNRHTGT